jgi:hypothetical protein
MGPPDKKGQAQMILAAFVRMRIHAAARILANAATASSVIPILFT